MLKPDSKSGDPELEALPVGFFLKEIGHDLGHERVKGTAGRVFGQLLEAGPGRVRDPGDDRLARETIERVVSDICPRTGRKILDQDFRLKFLDVGECGHTNLRNKVFSLWVTHRMGARR